MDKIYFGLFEKQIYKQFPILVLSIQQEIYIYVFLLSVIL